MNAQQIKNKYTCLDYLGERIVRKTSYGYIARCPWREDAHPSLTITPNGKGWQDHATGEHGNIIDLVGKCLGTTDLSRICAAFTDEWYPQPSSFEKLREEETGFAMFQVVPLRIRTLYAYLHSRKINIQIAKLFLLEAHYNFKEVDGGRYLYALAYANNKGGYELRSSKFKGCTSPKTITCHWNIDGAPIVVFEGFMDMLSFATLCGEVQHNYIVLNSIVNVDAAIEVLQERNNKIFLCLDNDEAGRSTTKKMLDVLPVAIDISSRFYPAKDVNEYLAKNHCIYND